MLKENLRAMRRVMGTDNRETLITMNMLADVYTELGRSEEARRLRSEIFEVEKILVEAPYASARLKNSYAWNLLTFEQEELRDPHQALRFARDANEMTGFENPDFLDTLALAYHLTGQTAKAIETQKKAISLLPEGQRAYYEERLAEFQAAPEK